MINNQPGPLLGMVQWPSLIDVPTGLGKTSMLDVAVFVAAATASQQGQRRVGRRRCFFVVDRRVVVDEVTEHAQQLADALARAEADTGDAGGILAEVATRLRSFGGDLDGPVLPVTRMRGGTTWAAAWLQRPDSPGLVIGTVDQVGSRLLFRGYGVSGRRRPIDAALVGADALLLVDEAHLARALVETTEAVRDRDRIGVPLPGLDVVRLSATANVHPNSLAAPTDGTPGLAVETTGTADTAGPDTPGKIYLLDVDRHLAVPEAGRRLTAAKSLSLVTASDKDCPHVLARIARTLTAAAPDGAALAVLVVCNTVDTARTTHSLIVKAVGRRDSGLSGDVELLIGRCRPLDRAGLDARVRQRFGIGAARTDRPAVLVATQTVEVGVNLDADALVSESASWDALVQRFGRLNRLGRLDQRRGGGAAAVAVVVHDGQDAGPVYGVARDVTWRHLCSLIEPVTDIAAIDPSRAVGLGVSPLKCRALSDGMPDAATLNRTQVPILTTPILDRWTRTS